MHKKSMWKLPNYKVDVADIARKVFACYKRLFLILLGICTFFYILPPVFRYLWWSTPERKDPLRQCMDDRLAPFLKQNMEYNANIQHIPPQTNERKNIPYIGNGYFGLEISSDAFINLKYGRAMQLATQIQPLLSVLRHESSFSDSSESEITSLEATVTEYPNGIVWRYQCFPGYYVSYAYYAHRTHPHILMQELKITNTLNLMQNVNILVPRIIYRKLLNKRVITLPLASTGSNVIMDNFKEFYITTGLIKPQPNADENISILLTILMPLIRKNINLNNHSNLKLEVPMVIQYSMLSNINYDNKSKQQQDQITAQIEENEQKAIEAMLKFLHSKDLSVSKTLQRLRHAHITVWNGIWSTGLAISTSKAENALNGDRINATMYAVLSHVRSYEFEENTGGMPDIPTKQEIAKILTYAEGCYDSYHTLQAKNLWLPMTTLQQLNNLVSTWILTLEKHGCHNLIRAGASGVIQGMVLSFGSFRFSNQHLECNIAPQYLHRDFYFRRLNYGNHTHVNVSITVSNDNKAVINVVLDRSDGSYYACDGGCMDEPVLLTLNRYQFPVKVTEPLTAILYITEDKQHIMELHKALHVKEVIEAPAYEQHVIALHRHGHHLGGLPALFWVSIFAIIIVFHIFLCKLIIKEYCETPDKLRYRYSKP